MRIVSPSLALGVVLLAGFAGSSLLAQDQSEPSAAPAASAPTAAPQARHHANPQHQAKKMAKKLGLTADQEAQLEPILASRSQQMQAVHADSTLAPLDLRAKVKSIRQDSDAKVEALLTDTQKQQYEQLKASHKSKRQSAANSTNS